MHGRWRIAAGAAVLGFCSAPAVAATAADGQRAYDAGRFGDAMGIWSELGRRGDAEAAFGLGLLYDLGAGTEADPKTAFFWYGMAAEAGLPAAEFNLAAMYDAGRAAVRDPAQAALWYAKAAAHRHHRAAFDLGLLYAQGDGVPRNPDVAAAWFRLAAAGGLSAAATRLKVLEASRGDRPGGQLVTVLPISPRQNEALAPTRGDPTVELVWLAPPEPQPVHYEVQVREVDDPKLQSVYTGSVTTTAIAVPLAAGPHFYLWKVDTVGQGGERAEGDWCWFSFGATPGSEQSIAAGPAASRIDH